ncbi:MAG: hypothetical protein II336_12920 [Loktanella sp.]|nr:hypothetical protein [Loktanella sp.]
MIIAMVKKVKIPPKNEKIKRSTGQDCPFRIPGAYTPCPAIGQKRNGRIAAIAASRRSQSTDPATDPAIDPAQRLAGRAAI